MLRASLALIAAVVLIGATQPAQAQIFVPGYGYNYSYNYSYQYGNPYYGGYYGNPYLREYGYNTYRPYGYPQYNNYQPYYSAPSATGSSFQGGSNNGNYWYWLQQQANQGRIPQSEVNRRMYGR